MTKWKFDEERNDELRDYYPDYEEIKKQIEEAILKVNNGQSVLDNDCFRYWHDGGFIVLEK